MKNIMAKEMTQRFAEINLKSGIDEKESLKSAKAFYYWVMCTLEAIYWSRRCNSFVINLYAGEQRIFLLFRDLNGVESKFVYYLPYKHDDKKIATLMQKFVEIFNDIEYPLSDIISSPFFLATDLGIWEFSDNGENYKGYYHVNIAIDMLPDDNV